MKLHHLHLQNFRCFENLMVQFDPKLTVIVSENGMGKTASLDAISYGFGRLFSKLPGIYGVSSKKTDVRIMPDSKPSPFLAYYLEAFDFSGNIIRWSAKRKRDSSKTTLEEMRSAMRESGMERFGLRQINAFADTLIDRLNGDEPYCLPVIVYYGTSRAVFEVPLRRRESRKELSRFEGLGDALRPNTRFQSVFHWFCAMEDLERRERQRRRDFEHTLPELDAVRNAIETMLPGFRNPRTEVKPLRLVVDWDVNGDRKTLEITQLSDGYRTMLALAMDLARRMAQANPPGTCECGPGKALADSLQMPAIVLIDEVDLHLHPRWQQRVLGDLQRTFPNTQFIVTTHSPQVLTTVPSESIRIIENGRIFAAPPGTEGAEASRVLKRVFGVDICPQDNPVARELLEYLSLVYADQWESQRAIELRSRLDEKFRDEEPALVEADLHIENRKWEKGDESGL